MKRLAVFLILASASFAQTPSQFGGIYNALNYAYGVNGSPVPPLVVDAGPNGAGSGTLTLAYGYAMTNDGQQFFPLAVNAPITVGYGASIETVTPSAINCGTPSKLDTCSVTATFSFAHGNGDRVRSGTIGLQEALNAASFFGGSAIVSGQWAAQGGTTAMINAATIPGNTAIADNRNGTFGSGGGGGGATLGANTFTGSQTLTGGNAVINTRNIAGESYQFNGRDGVGIPVPYVTPTTNLKQIAFDIFPHANVQLADLSLATGVAWQDVCSNDVNDPTLGGANFECLRIAKTSPTGSHSGAGQLSTVVGGTGTTRPLNIQGLSAGNVGIKDDTPDQVLSVTGNSPFGIDLRTVSGQTGVTRGYFAIGAFFTGAGTTDTNLRATAGALNLGANSGTSVPPISIALGTTAPGTVTVNSTMKLAVHSTTGTNYVCVDTTGTVTASPTPCSGT